MQKSILTFALLTALAACGGSGTNPFQTTEVDTGTGTGADEESTTDFSKLTDDMRGVVFDPDAGTLSVDLTGLDQTNGQYPLAAYNRTPQLDVEGYLAFTYQDDPLDRHYTAFVAQDFARTVQGAVASDGGQFNIYMSGSTFIALEAFVNPTPSLTGSDNGLVSYAGHYAGVTNMGAVNELLLEPTIEVYDGIPPRQTLTVQGQIFLNVDFGDNLINGIIYHREWGNTPLPHYTPTYDDEGYLPDIVLTVTSINDVGEFYGEAQNTAQKVIGNYGGVFGGANAEGVAGGIFVEDHVGVENADEYGVFVLTQCGLTGDDPICVTVNPDYGN
ncbi:hypothetical protein B9057_05115 [Aestuarium zhoushanense]|nr:hypothetical protein B9057_05115 [Aestuarium zhoushanense]